MSEVLIENQLPHHGLQNKILKDNSIRLNDCINEFNAMKVAEYTPIIELKPYNVSLFRDRIVKTGTASVTIPFPGEYKITSGVGESISFQSASWGRYLPGLICEPGMGIRIPTTPASDTIYKWGYFRGNTGIYFQWDATGWYAVVEDQGTILAKVERNAGWKDKLDGTGPSGLSTNPIDGLVARFPFIWYGYGPINFNILAKDDNGISKLVDVFTATFKGRKSISTPNLPLNFSIEGAGEAYVGGRQYGVYGNYNPQYRFTGISHVITSVGTSFVPFISFNQPIDGNPLNQVAIKLGDLSLLNSADIEWKIVAGHTLTGSNFIKLADTPDNEHSTVWDTSSSAYSGGIPLFGGYIAAGSGNAAGSILESLPKFDLPKDTNITLLLRTISGTDTINGRFTCREEL